MQNEPVPPFMHCVSDVLITGELKRRSARAVNYVAENRAMAVLAAHMAGDPESVMRKLADSAAELCHADSAGISILESDDGQELFRWRAVTGAFAFNLNATIPRLASPCGIAIAGSEALLFRDPGCCFPTLRHAEIRIHEALIVPWIVHGRAIGTIWTVDHSGARHFDQEDANTLERLAAFAAAAYQVSTAREEARVAREELEHRVAERTHLLSQSNKTLQQEVEHRRKAEAAMQRLYELYARLTIESDLYAALDDILAAACLFTATDRGCVQIVSPTGGNLEIVAQRGYGPDSPFIEHFRYEGFAQGCDVARIERRRLIIEDIDTVADLDGTPAGDAARADGIRATQSTPMISRQGETIGVLSTQFRQPHRSSDEALRMMDLLAWAGADFIERHRAEAALRESERRLRALTSASTEAIYRMSPDWAQMRQLDGRNFLKNTVSPTHSWLNEYIPAEHHGVVQQAIDDAIRDKTVFKLEHRVHRADGTFGWTLSRAVPMLDAHGAIYEWVGAASDISERKDTEEKLKEANQRKDEFLAMLAHELRNPLAPISAAAELLQRVNMDGRRLQQTSQIIARQVSHMTVLIDDLLDVSRVTRGLVDLNNSELDVRQIVMDAVEQVGPLIQARRHHLTLDMPDNATTVMGDKQRLVQVVANILNNSAKYTNEGGAIRLHISVEESTVLIAISDNGVGMAPELACRAFELFTQAERTSDRSSGGLGLGLSLVKSLVELHAGSVSCCSPGIGAGSTFTVRLPRLQRDSIGLALPQADVVATAPLTALRVLVVDDNVDAAAMLELYLHTAGHHVLVEHRSVLALERARQSGPQVCLIDIGLPEMDGNELARRLRSDPRTANAMLIAITGYGQESDRNRALAAGFDHHMVKPVDMENLESILASIH